MKLLQVNWILSIFFLSINLLSVSKHITLVLQRTICRCFDIERHLVCITCLFIQISVRNRLVSSSHLIMVFNASICEQNVIPTSFRIAQMNVWTRDT